MSIPNPPSLSHRSSAEQLRTQSLRHQRRVEASVPSACVLYTLIRGHSTPRKSRNLGFQKHCMRAVGRKGYEKGKQACAQHSEGVANAVRRCSRACSHSAGQGNTIWCNGWPGQHGDTLENVSMTRFSRPMSSLSMASVQAATKSTIEVRGFITPDTIRNIHSTNTTNNTAYAKNDNNSKPSNKQANRHQHKST